MKWNLDNLYTSFDSEEFQRDFNKLKELLEEMNKFTKKLDNEDLEQVVALEEYVNIGIKVRTISYKLYAFCSLTISTDSKNAVALRYLERINKIHSDFTGPYAVINNYIKTFTDDKMTTIIDSSELLKEHEFLLLRDYTYTKYMLSEKEEILLSKLKQTSSAAWSTLQNKLSSNLLVDIEVDGEMKQLPLSIVRNMAREGSSESRLNAYKAELEAYKKCDESSAAALNGIKGEVLVESELRGFDTPLEKTLFDSNMKKETLTAMLGAMKSYFPKFRDYFKRKASVLGYENGLPFYELFAPLKTEKENSKVSFDEARTFIIENFRSFSEELADFAKEAFEQQWVDVEPREGKRGGAFCYNLPPIKESRIMLNFTGSLNDVITAAHELGHGYHGKQIFSESILNTSYPMPLAETASIFCETIVKKSAIKKAEGNERLNILETSIQGYAQIIVDIYSRYIFETNLFEKREDASVAVEELNEMMLDAQRQTYGDGLDENFLHPYMWMNKSHYYSASRNFYNFPYAFGLLFAKGLYAKYVELGDVFIGKYNYLLQMTGQMSIEEVALLMDIDVTDEGFWLKSLEIIGEEIDEFMELTK